MSRLREVIKELKTYSGMIHAFDNDLMISFGTKCYKVIWTKHDVIMVTSFTEPEFEELEDQIIEILSERFYIRSSSEQISLKTIPIMLDSMRFDNWGNLIYHK